MNELVNEARQGEVWVKSTLIATKYGLCPHRGRGSFIKSMIYASYAVDFTHTRAEWFPVEAIRDFPIRLVPYVAQHVIIRLNKAG
jgi:hypothetical protein